MVSLIADLSESKCRRAARGWVFFDADCAFCTRMARRIEPVLERRGYGFAALQDPRTGAALGLPREERLREMRVLTADSRQFGGAGAFVYLAKQVWWAWPMWALAHVPGMRGVLRAGYRWIAARRACTVCGCSRAEVIHGSSPRKGVSP